LPEGSAVANTIVSAIKLVISSALTSVLAEFAGDKLLGSSFID
jgi:hypothetical protein